MEIFDLLLLVGGFVFAIAIAILGFISDPFNKCKILRAINKRKMVVLVAGKGAGEVLSFIVDMPVSDREVKIIVDKDKEPLSFVPNPEFVKVFKGVPFIVVDAEDCKPIPLESPFGSKWVTYAHPNWVSRLISPIKLDAFLTNVYNLGRARARQQFEKNTINNWLPYLQLVATVGVLIFLVVVWTGQAHTDSILSTIGNNIDLIAQKIGANVTSGGIAHS